MFEIPGYKLSEKIYEGTRTIVYRGIKVLDNQPIILKALKDNYPHPKDIARIKHEYEIIKNIKIEGVVKTFGLENYRNSFALIMEDFGGTSLDSILKKEQIDLGSFLRIGISLAQTIREIHQLNVIHKDIKPQNIIINPNTSQVKITDFCLASRLFSETQNAIDPNLLEGTIAYMSPEQTGRMNRSVDYRTDFYSLGVTFYQIIAGQLPYQNTDAMELIHCHIAKKAAPPHLLVPTIPRVISDIVMKLLAKTAEDRYQSAAGLKFDLETCLSELETTGKIEYFIPGQRDRGHQLLIPQKLYGREAEVATLMAAFDRISNHNSALVSASPNSPTLKGTEVTTKGRAELMLVSGYSGIGKTSVVNEVHKPIVKARGYFTTGKFDQFKRNIPYSALIQAFRELIGQLLTENSQKIDRWKEKLLDALGQNGQVIIDAIPEVELIIGKQPAVTPMGPTESQNRFIRVFKQFIQVFCQPEHPLVIFLDDLQWADSASLNLLQLLITDSESQYLLPIAAYRDNEVSPTHPFIQTLEKIQETDALVNNITLQPLGISHVKQLVADTFNLNFESEQIRTLVELLFNKTQGNPFFLTQLLKTLHSENLLIYQVATDRWEWDIKQIQSVGLADYNIVDLIARNISKLPESTQKVLKMAACIGNQFNLDVLAIVNEKSQTATATDLWDALQAGLVLPLTDDYKIPMVEDLETKDPQLTSTNSQFSISYKFLHDRVQQAAYSLIPEAERKATHLKIGQLLLTNISPEERKENIFALVNQLNFGIDLLHSRSEKDELAALNLIAARKAKAAAAYEAAINYLDLGLSLLGTDSWDLQYDLSLDIYLEISEVEYLNANLERADTLCNIGIERARTLVEKVKFSTIQILINLARGEIKTALDIGVNVIEKLGVRLIESPPQNLDFEALASLPKMTDPEKLAAMKILMHIYPPAAFRDEKIARPIIYTMVNISNQYGNCLPSIFAYSNYGAIVSWLIPDIELGYQLGQLSLKVLDNLNAKEFQCKTYVVVSILIQHWKEHIKKTIEPLLQAIQSGLEVGDIEFACHAADFYCAHLFFSGEYLETVTQKIDRYLVFIDRFKQQYQLGLLKIFAQVVENLTEPTITSHELTGKFFNEKENLPYLVEVNHVIYLFYVYIFKSILCYIFKQYEGALENAKIASQYIGNYRDIVIYVQHIFYYSLALIKRCEADRENQETYLLEVEHHQKKMKYWADGCPINYQHKYDLIEAEKARLLGQKLEAMDYYDRAIEGAKTHGYIQEEALAYEKAAEFYLQLKRQKIAQTYMTEAYYAYARWGATAKVNALQLEYPDLIYRTAATDQAITIDASLSSTMTTAHAGSALDLAAVMKASLAISGEILLEKLLEKLMQICIENAGARKGYLILVKNGKLSIEAAASINTAELIVQQSTLVETFQDLPLTVINYVEKTQSDVVLSNAIGEGKFTCDPYVERKQLKSMLCTPIVNQGRLIAILYLENNLTLGAFTNERLQILKILSSQAAVSLENAVLYENLATANERLEVYNRNLEQRVEERTLELKAKEARLREAERLAHLGNWEFDLETQKITWSNELFRIFGLHPEQPEPTYSEHQNFIHPDDWESLDAAVKTAIQKGTSYEIELRILRQNTSTGYVLNKGKATKNSAGQVVKLFGTVQDITDRKLVEDALRNSEAQLREQTQQLELTLRELQQTQSQLIQTEKMSSLGQMVAGIAHEINNPVNFIYGNIHYADSYIKNLLVLIDIYQQEYPTPTAKVRDISEDMDLEFLVEDLTKLLSSMRLGAERIQKIVRSLRNFSRLDEAEMKPVDIHEGIESTLIILQHRTKKDMHHPAIEIIKDYGELPQVSCYASQLNQVFMNILSNAIDALEELQPNHPTIKIRTEIRDRNWVAIRISDNGPGIDERVLKKIFDPFFTTKPVGSGTGLGLSISYQIVVEKHRGKLNCASVPGEGTEFTIELPIAP